MFFNEAIEWLLVIQAINYKYCIGGKIRVSNLELKTYKNYKELCSVMGWNITGGSYKKSRLKSLSSLCIYHKEGNKFIIDEIFDIPREKEDGRINNKGGNNSVYVEDVDKLIVHMCY